MAHSAQDTILFTDPANGGPSAVLAVALNDKLDQITLSRIITVSILHFKVHTTYCIRLSMATGA